MSNKTVQYLVSPIRERGEKRLELQVLLDAETLAEHCTYVISSYE